MKQQYLFSLYLYPFLAARCCVFILLVLLILVFTNLQMPAALCGTPTVWLQLPVPGSIASLQMTPQGVVRSFYPLKGNEAALNHNLFKDPNRRAAALETVASGELTMQGPITLLQGFRGAVGRVPVFISNVSEDEWFG